MGDIECLESSVFHRQFEVGLLQDSSTTSTSCALKISVVRHRNRQMSWVSITFRCEMLFCWVLRKVEGSVVAFEFEPCVHIVIGVFHNDSRRRSVKSQNSVVMSSTTFVSHKSPVVGLE